MKEFADNDNVVFADINLRDAPIRGNYNPGAGGWPTVRVFNSETGPDGAAYEKKTSKSMCDELGPKETYMSQYVEDFLPKCFVSDPTNGCNEKEQKFITKFAAKSPEDVTKQIKRLQGLASGKMAPALKTWLNQRLLILKQLKPAAGHDEL